MGISARTVTIWASSARRIPRNDPNFGRILAWATLRFFRFVFFAFFAFPSLP